MKVYVEVNPSTLSRAMHRVADALREYAPSTIECVKTSREAELVLLHCIGITDMSAVIRRVKARGGKVGIIQYCLDTAGGTIGEWCDIWSEAHIVWSYYDLNARAHRVLPNFHYAPLGVGAPFTDIAYAERDRSIHIMTSGYVSGPGAEAIEDVAFAAERAGKSVVHLGPSDVVGMSRTPRNWRAVHDITDDELASYYRQARWVSGLRHGEGFELPVLEGLVSGARPIVFDRSDMRKWYTDHAVFVPESSGESLIGPLADILSRVATPVSREEREHVSQVFAWSTVAHNFWRKVLGES